MGDVLRLDESPILSAHKPVMSSPIRVLAVMEASKMTGPAKNLVEFARNAGTPAPGVPPVSVSIATFVRGGFDSAFSTAVRQAGIEVFTIHERRVYDTSAILELKRLAADFRPDVLQSHNVKSHFYIALTRMYRRFPWVAFNHGYTATNFKDRAYNQIDRWSLRHAYRVVTVCKPFAQRIARLGVDISRIQVQHNSADTFIEPARPALEAVRLELGIHEEQVILCIGRMSAEKGHADLLQAIALLRQRAELPAFRVVFLGDGPEREKLESAAERLGVAFRCHFAGHRNELAPWYGLAAIMALPSHSEGSPNVVLEAMAAGVPVVATNVGGVPELLEDGISGIMVPSRDPIRMADALSRLLLDEELRRRLARAAQQHVSSTFTREVHRASLARFYERVVSDWRKSQVPNGR